MTEILTIFDFLEASHMEMLRRLSVCRECKCKPVISSSRGIICPICGKAAANEESWEGANNG